MNSLFFPDFTLVDQPDYLDEIRIFLGLKMRTDTSDWPLLRLERQIVLKYDAWGLGEITGDRIEHHMIRYLCHLVPSLEPDPWFQEKVWS
jgi:hypothetical protein